MTVPDPESRSPFRQQALEYIATPKALNDLIQVISPLTWVLTVALWLILGSIALWLCFGRIVTHISGQGVLLTDRTAVIYVSALTAQRLYPGMSMHVSPSSTKKWGYRRIPGQVATIDYLPATPENMLTTLKNLSLVSYFLRAGPVITLYAQLNTESLPPGSLIDARITVRRQSPLSLMLSR